MIEFEVIKGDRGRERIRSISESVSSRIRTKPTKNGRKRRLGWILCGERLILGGTVVGEANLVFGVLSDSSPSKQLGKAEKSASRLNMFLRWFDAS